MSGKYIVRKILWANWVVRGVLTCGRSGALGPFAQNLTDMWDSTAAGILGISSKDSFPSSHGDSEKQDGAADFVGGMLDNITAGWISNNLKASKLEPGNLGANGHIERLVAVAIEGVALQWARREPQAEKVKGECKALAAALHGTWLKLSPLNSPIPPGKEIGDVNCGSWITGKLDELSTGKVHSKIFEYIESPFGAPTLTEEIWLHVIVTACMAKKIELPQELQKSCAVALHMEVAHFLYAAAKMSAKEDQEAFAALELHLLHEQTAILRSLHRHAGELSEWMGGQFGTLIDLCTNISVVSDRLIEGQQSMSAEFRAMRQDLSELHELLKLYIQSSASAKEQKFRKTLTSNIPASRYLVAEKNAIVGRDKDVKKLVRHLEKRRLITIHGLPCLGKTTAGLEVLRYYSEVRGLPTYFVDLHLAETEGGIADTMSRSFSLKSYITASNGSQEDPNHRIGIHIASLGECLILLDNFEQITRYAASTIRRWMLEAPYARFLVTSRRVLGLDEELDYLLKPLDCPTLDEAQCCHISTLRKFAAVRLFMARARKWGRLKSISPDDIRRIARICARTGGFPAPVVVAAKRLKHMGLRDLEDSIGSVLAESRNREEDEARTCLHLQLRGIYKELAIDEQLCLLQFSQFRGGFDLNGAAAIVADLGKSILLGKNHLAPIIGKLLEYGFLFAMPSANGNFRYNFYLPIEEWAEARWEEYAASVLAAVKISFWQRFSDYYSGFFESHSERIGDRQSHLLKLRLREERENLLQGVKVCVHTKQSAGAARAILAIAPYLRIEGPASSFAMLLKDVMEMEGLNIVTQAKLYLELSRVQWQLGRWNDPKSGALCLAKNALIIAEKSGNRDLILECDLWLTRRRSDDDLSSEETLAELSRIRDLSRDLSNRSIFLITSLDISAAMGNGARQEEALEILAEIEPDLEEVDASLHAQLLNCRGLLLWRDGRAAMAKVAFQKSMKINGDLRDFVWLGGNKTNMALACTDTEDFEEALIYLEEASELHLSQSNPAWNSVNMVAKVRWYVRQSKFLDALALASEVEPQVRLVNYRENIILLEILKGISLANLNQHQAALEILSAVVENIRDPMMLRHFSVRVVGAKCLVALSRHAEAEKWIAVAEYIARERFIDSNHPAHYVQKRYDEMKIIKHKITHAC